MAEESRVPTAPIAHPSDRRDRLSSPASFSYVFCSFSLFLRLFESSPFFLLSARRRLSNTIQEVVHEGINKNVENRRSAVDKLTQIRVGDEIAYYSYGKKSYSVKCYRCKRQTSRFT